ncbi:MAG: SRPBCC family protein [Thaumarchaeota archaeon]|nr:SRPBCC family protein [Nitrososphaerota archaeon]
MLIQEKLGFKGEPVAVWKRVSDIERMPEFWHGTRSLQVVGREGNKTRIKAKFAFGGSRDVEVTTDEANRTLALSYASGPFTGVQTVTVAGNTLEARWDIEFKGIYRLGASRIAGHFRTGTVHALARLVGEKVVKEAPSHEGIAQV